MKTITRGIIHGKTIELPEETGLPEGQEVTVTLEAVAADSSPGAGIRESAGGWAEATDPANRHAPVKLGTRTRIRRSITAFRRRSRGTRASFGDSR